MSFYDYEREQRQADEARWEEQYGRDGDDLYRDEFADPTGHSALRAATDTDPRSHPCPTCGFPNRLTQRDLNLGYQCDTCADRLERGLEVIYFDD